QLLLEHGKPLIFGAKRDKGIRMRGHSLEVVKLGNGITEADVIVHDETDSALAFLLSLMAPPKFPTPLGVFRAEERPTYEAVMSQQIQAAKQRQGNGDLEKLLSRGDTWTVS